VDRRTYMKLIVDFRNSAKAPKMRFVILGPVLQIHASAMLLLQMCSNSRGTALGECVYNLVKTSPLLQKLK
jgi:hypothetical protein